MPCWEFVGLPLVTSRPGRHAVLQLHVVYVRSGSARQYIVQTLAEKTSPISDRSGSLNSTVGHHITVVYFFYVVNQEITIYQAKHVVLVPYRCEWCALALHWQGI